MLPSLILKYIRHIYKKNLERNLNSSSYFSEKFLAFSPLVLAKVSTLKKKWVILLIHSINLEQASSKEAKHTREPSLFFHVFSSTGKYIRRCNSNPVDHIPESSWWFIEGVTVIHAKCNSQLQSVDKHVPWYPTNLKSNFVKPLKMKKKGRRD